MNFLRPEQLHHIRGRSQGAAFIVFGWRKVIFTAFFLPLAKLFVNKDGAFFEVDTVPHEPQKLALPHSCEEINGKQEFIFAAFVGEWLDTWLKTYALYSVKSYTYDAYERSYNIHIKPALGRIRLSALTAPQIQQFYNSLITEKELSPKTVKNIHGVLHRALGQAVKLGMLHSNPTNVCDLPKAHRKEIKPMEQAEITKFLQAIQGTKYGLVYQITLFTGLREGEVLGLTWGCIDFQHNAIYINKQLQKTKKVGGTYCLAPTKNSRNRTILTAPSVMALLRKQKSQQAQMRLLAGEAWNNSWDLVFTNELGGHLCHCTVYKKFKAIVRELGMPEERFHDLRHSFAVASIESGDDIKTVQSNLGHATASFTLDVYGHVSQKMRQQSADRMEEFIQKVSG